MNRTDTLRIVIVGHVDHGKSTLIGRLFYDTGSIPESRYREIEDTCRRQGRPFEFAYLMDALEEEREQNVTIDTAQTFFRWQGRPYVIIDAPGHKEFLKNMITGAASADAAVLLLDGVEGVREQTRRHAFILSLLGIRHVVVAVNKLDKADYDRATFLQAENDVRSLLHSLGIAPDHVIPISAREGENIARRLGRTPWYDGPTVLEALATLGGTQDEDALPLRFPVQDVYTWDNRRLYVGRVETGRVRRGDAVRFFPSGRTARVKTVERWGDPPLEEARSGDCVGLTFDEELFVERGEVMGHPDRGPVVGREIRASLFWLGKAPLERGKTVILKVATTEVEAQCLDIEDRIDASTLEVLERHAERLESPEVGNVLLRLRHPAALDAFQDNPKLGRFVLQDGAFIAGGGIVREARALGGVRAAQVIHLDRQFATEPDGYVVDLTQERGAVEFEVTPHFLDLVAAGNRVLFRLRGPEQVAPVALLAYEHDLEFTFRRTGERVGLVLWRRATPQPSAPLEGLGL
ncbi:sulfate adenylyltransferase subunit 1 [Deferrisoma palaeochoriense]